MPFHTIPHCSGTGQVFQAFHSVPPLRSTVEHLPLLQMWTKRHIGCCSDVPFTNFCSVDSKTTWMGVLTFLYMTPRIASNVSLSHLAPGRHKWDTRVVFPSFPCNQRP